MWGLATTFFNGSFYMMLSITDYLPLYIKRR
nr:MAG TPA: hypothetical protein [Caudoviricetes sp.]